MEVQEEHDGLVLSGRNHAVLMPYTTEEDDSNHSEGTHVAHQIDNVM